RCRHGSRSCRSVDTIADRTARSDEYALIRTDMDEEYILLPSRRLHIPRERGGPALSLLMGMQSARSTNPPLVMTFPGTPHMDFLAFLNIVRGRPRHLGVPGTPPIHVIDSVNENGPKLVKADQETALAARKLGLRLEPVIRYRAAGRFRVNPPAGSGAG